MSLQTTVNKSEHISYGPNLGFSDTCLFVDVAMTCPTGTMPNCANDMEFVSLFTVHIKMKISHDAVLTII